MCFVIGPQMMAAAFSTGFSLFTQAQNASAAEKHQKQQFELQKKITHADSLSKYAAIADKYEERQISSSYALLENQRKALEARGTLRVMSGDAGVEMEHDYGQKDILKQEQGFNFALGQQDEFYTAQFIREGEAIHSGAYASLLAAAPDPVPAPDYLGGFGNILAGAHKDYLDETLFR